MLKAANQVQVSLHDSKLEKRVANLLQVGMRLLPQVEDFKCLKFIFTSKGGMELKIDRQIDAAATTQCQGREKADPKGKALNLPFGHF